MDDIELIFRMKGKIPNNNCYSYRTTLYKMNSNILNEIKSNYDFAKQMEKDYFPVSMDIICRRQMRYDENENNSIYNILKWATELFNTYEDKINTFIDLKIKYERALFSENYNLAYKILDRIDKKICSSVWGVHQKFLTAHLDEKNENAKRMLSEIESKAEKNSFAALLLIYYEKMSDTSVAFQEYSNSIEHLLDGASEKNIVWKYFNYKLNIIQSPDVQEIKSALIFDEQLSMIDFYETYIDSLQILSERKVSIDYIKSYIRSLYPDIKDYRIKNLYLSLFDIEDSLNIDKAICSVIEKYTCGNYEELCEECPQYIKNIRNDYTLCNLFLKAGIDISDYNVPFKKLWHEVYKVYMFNYNVEESLQTIAGYFKILYGTSWRYKILGVLIRKLNFSYNTEILRLSILNDKAMTPLFYQALTNHNNKLKFLEKFNEYAPTTSQLHLFVLTGNKDDSIQKKIDPIRWCYYEISKLVNQKEYRLGIEKCELFLKNYGKNNSMLYYQERIRRKLFDCYLELEDYISAMNLYVSSYILNTELVLHMELSKLIVGVEEIAEEDEKIKGNISRPIILRLFYKNLDDEVISAYLDYLESKYCITICQLIDKYDYLDFYDVLFLNRVCTQSLLMKDYVSKTEVGGSASELRANILRCLIAMDEKNKKEYFSELNSIYKSNQLQKKIDSFNHTRIFIDKENLYNYLKDGLAQEFSRFKTVQEIRKSLHNSKLELQDVRVLIEQYWDIQRFYEGIIEKIKKAYLNDSPYSLEDFLSTRIRHNYCNDNLKKVFEEEKLFSMKEKDNSADYTVNEYWEEKLLSQDYEKVVGKLGEFSQTIDSKIQEIKEKWIRIKKDEKSEGLFDYLGFTNYFMNYTEIDFENAIDNVEEFFNCVIRELDVYTEIILKSIRDKIESDLKSTYSMAILKLESDVKMINFDYVLKSEMMRKIETTKAKYIEDIEAFKDIFHIQNEIYPDFTMYDLIEFCCTIENDMNNQFGKTNVDSKVKVLKKFRGELFPYLVDIMGILIRNAVQHSLISDMKKLNIVINVIPYSGSEVEKTILQNKSDDVRYTKFNRSSVVFNVINNLSNDVDEEAISYNVKEKIDNIYNGRFRDKSNKEGGSGLYKIARTVSYSLNSSVIFFQKQHKGFFNISIIIDLSQFEVKE